MESINVILFDAEERKELLPLTYTRPVADLRIGILKIFRKWEIALKSRVSFLTEEYLSKKYILEIKADNLLINGSLLPNKNIIKEIFKLEQNEAIVYNDSLLAVRLNRKDTIRLNETDFGHISIRKISDFKCVNKVNHLWDLFQMNDAELRNDFNVLTKGKKSKELSSTNTIIGQGEIFIEEGATIEGAVLNVGNGPIYISKGAEVMEGSMIRGPFFLGSNSTVKMGAKIYGATSIGENCKVGGEVSNVIFQAFSNKGHDGFLGNAVIGEWCNIGADTNNSNLKNNYAPVKVWNYIKGGFENTGMQFCGLFMGDYSKTGINTMFNTGTVVGVSANTFGPGFPRTFVPSFSWGGHQGFSTFKLEKVFETARVVMERRGLEFGDVDKDILKHVYNLTEGYRAWEK